MKSNAAVFLGQGRPVEVLEIDVADPGPSDVVVRMAAVGICGTDLHYVNGEWDRPTPMVLAHEGSGVIDAVGSNVHQLREGDHVVLAWSPSCGVCPDCRR